MGEDSGEKTEEPTPHKLREARKKGQIAKSKDLTAALLMLASFYTLKASGEYIWGKLTQILFMSFDFFASDFSASVAGFLLYNVMTIFLSAMAPLFAVNMLVAIILEALQTGFLISFEPLEPSFEKLNPIEGMKKFFSLKQYVELIKSVVKMTIVILIIYFAIKDEMIMILISQQMQMYQVMAFTGTIVMRVILRVGIFYFLIGILDYFYQRFEYVKGLKMSKKEIKDEYKRLEGDPMVKQRQRDAQRQMAQGRQMGAIPDADVVVTNPIHVAIAIQYSPNKMRAPRVVAKGRRLVAKEIRRLAELHQIPIIENPPLARSLYDVARVGDFVPPMFYKAVAEILAFVYNLKKKKKNRF
jgi:flagellar biosynthesis protein FlhB